MIEWVQAGAADGFNIMPAYFPGRFEDFTREVVPILQDRGAFRRDYEGRTLREHLELPLPHRPARPDGAPDGPRPRASPPLR